MRSPVLSPARRCPGLTVPVIAALLAAAAAAPPLRAERPRVYAITGGRVIVSPGEVIEEGTVILRDGLIEGVGRGIAIPPDAEVVDGSKKTVHAGFIDACSEIGVPRREPARPPSPEAAGSQAPQRTEGARHPISRIRPEQRVIDILSPAERDLEKHRKLGFTAALAVPNEGIFRGSSALVSLGDGPLSENIIRAEVAQHIALEHGSWGAGYPSSLMGSMAAIRQGFEDARRYAIWRSRYEAQPRGMKRPGTLSAYEPIHEALSGSMPVVFDVTTANDVARVLRLAREFDLAPLVVGSGTDYEVRDRIAAAGSPIILPLEFPEKPEIDDPDEALDVSIQRLERYLGVRENPGRLAEAGIPVAFGTCRMDNISEFPSNLRRIIDAGYSRDQALAALTTTPARMLGVDRSMGSLEKGKAAHVVVQDGELFEKKTKPVIVFVDGVEYRIEDKMPKGDPTAKVDPRGTWSMVYSAFGRTFNRTWTISGSKGAWEGTAETQEATVRFSSIELVGNEITLVIPSPRGGRSWEVTGIITGDSFEGTGELPGGRTLTIKGTRTSGPPAEPESEEGYSCMEEVL